MDFKDNTQIKLAYEFVQYTNKNIFLTGKAGTGKTTFLNNLKLHTHKRMIVTAPTGVAAINAGGVTIHSFFQLPFSPFVPEEAVQNPSINIDYNRTSSSQIFKLRKNKIKIIKSLDLLVIDEISMVRADLLDAIDSVLRRYRNNDKPFGGVQLLMIGDLHQLSPVIKEEEWGLVRDYYKTVYFFSSNALKKTDFITIELKKIYRQEDEQFIQILGEVRDNKLSKQSLDILNSRYDKDFDPDEGEGYITLTTHNATALEINNRKHEKLKAKIYKFKAVIKGDFPEFIFPTLEILELKPGAQVMFIKNDSAQEKLYYNGKIGKITKIYDDIIFVKCAGDKNEIAVTPEIWENIKYKFDEKTKNIDEEVAGSFEQYPLKLAWAITVHKSQGLTFDKAVIDINSAFAFGQVYVALSRCRSLQGMVLLSKFSAYNIKTDNTIEGFTEESRQNQPDNQALSLSKKEFQQKLILELFDFTDIRKTFFYIRKIVKENIGSFDIATLEKLEEVKNNSAEQIFKISERFENQLTKFFQNNTEPQDDPIIQERIIKACGYFIDKLEEIYYETFRQLNFDPDNKELNNSISDAVEKFELLLVTKTNCLNQAKDGFDTIKHIKSIADSELDFKPKFNRQTPSIKVYEPSEGIKDLFKILNAWRKSVAEDESVPVFMVLPQKSLKELVEFLPATTKQLANISGFGKVKLNKYGSDILDIINDFCVENGIEREIINYDDFNIETGRVQKSTRNNTEKEKKEPKKKSHLISYEMFCEGKDIQTIAQERNFTESTIIGHLTKYAAEGKIDPEQLITKNTYLAIQKLLQENPGMVMLKDLYDISDGKFSYQDLRLVVTLHLSEKEN